MAHNRFQEKARHSAKVFDPAPRDLVITYDEHACKSCNTKIMYSAIRCPTCGEKL